MAPVTVDLGNFTIRSYLDMHFLLTVSSAMLLVLPEDYPHPQVPTAAELRDQVRAGSIWITGAGSCHFELNIGLGDSLNPNLQDQLQHMILEAFEAFPVS